MQLLSDCEYPQTLFAHPMWAAEEKKDGDRMIVRKTGGIILCCTRTENAAKTPAVLEAVASLSDSDWIIDGELMAGGQFFAFDIVSAFGESCELQSNSTRRELLEALSPFPCVRRAVGEQAKRELFEEVKREKGEGIVFKMITRPYEHARVDHQVRHKLYFVENMTVSAVNLAKCSVEVSMNGKPLGSVPSHLNSLPKVGDTIRVRYERITEKGKLLRGKIVK